MTPLDPASIAMSTFALVALAEVGDKSQLVCMTLATRYRHWPVLLGATTAFVILNVLAVLFGAGIAAWVPERIMAGVVAVMFATFGVHALLNQGDEDSEEVSDKPGHGIFFTTLLLILVAEFGDKTQFAIAGLAGSMAPFPVWVGATVALTMVSAFGVWAGRTVLQRLPLHWLHRAGGAIFLTFAAMATWRALTL
jgi:putative Ca2+/H+ antiporter (TMEM165/GDT1 family)